MNYIARDLWHWHENAILLMKFLSLAALEVVILTTSSAASNENLIKMKMFPVSVDISRESPLEFPSNILVDYLLLWGCQQET